MDLGAFSISLAVADLDRSIAFYDRLGFTVTGGGDDWKILANGTTLIGLFAGIIPENILTFNPGLTNDMAESDEFTDVRDVQAALQAAGVELEQTTDADGTGPAHITLRDPDGNAILIDQFAPRPGHEDPTG